MARRGARAGNLYRFAINHEDEVRQEVSAYKHLAGRSAEVGHCAAVVAKNVYRLTDKEWNGPSGGEYFAAMYAFIKWMKIY